MNYLAIQRIIGLLLLAFSAVYLPPVLVAWFYDEPLMSIFFESFVIVAATGALAWLPVRGLRTRAHRRESVLVVALFWIILGFAGAIPFLLMQEDSLRFTEAVFESVSGLTTTGATAIVGLDGMAHAVLFYRQLLQWVGGMGMVVLAVAVLPLLGVGGMQLFLAESPGPAKQARLTPRIGQTARALWGIYVVMTVACAFSYRIAGMSTFDAICHSFSTVSLGAFSTHDASIGYFMSPTVELVAIVFMFMSGISFVLHFHALKQRQFSLYLRDPEFRAYASLLFVLGAFVISHLAYSDQYDSVTATVVNGLFHVVSIMTTTGYTAGGFSQWPAMLPVMLLLASFIGACAKSTGGGMKVVRWVLLVKQGWREVRRLIHPRAEFVTKIGNHAVPDRVVGAVWGFFSVYVGVFAVLLIVTMLLGLDHVTAFSAVAASLNNLGPGLGEVSDNYASAPEAVKWVLMLAMILGRLEIFTLLILLTPAFWRR